MAPSPHPAAAPLPPSEIAGRDLRVDYDKRTVLDVPDITIRAGSTYALLGASGAGKSTLLRVLGLLERPSAGTVLHDGLTVARDDLKARRRIAAVFQKPYLLRGTVGKNVGYGLRLRGVGRAETARRVAEALESVGLSGWEKRAALTLSGGEAQRVALARAIVLRPTLLLLDEPLSYLDPLLKRELTSVFAEILASNAVTAIYVTHDQEEAAIVADSIGIMRDGRVLAQGPASSVLSMPSDPWVASFLGTVVPMEGVIARRADGVTVVDCRGLTIAANSDLPVGSAVRVGVRPETVVVLARDAGLAERPDRSAIPAEVVEMTADGTATRLVVESSGNRMAATVPISSAEAMGLQPGSGVTLLIAVSAVRVEPV